MKNIYLLLVITFAFINCKPKTAENATIPAKQEVIDETAIDENTIIEISNIDLNDVEYEPQDRVLKQIYDMGGFKMKAVAEQGEVTTLKLNSEGLSRAYDEKLNFEGRIDEGFVLDLDGDGFKELYMACSITDDSGNKDLMGWCSYKDKAMGKIYIKDTQTSRQVNTDKLFSKDGKLYRSFKDGDGALKTFDYTLSKGEAGMQLVAKAMK